MNLSQPISWDQYFMGIAQFSAFRSKDPVTKVGACIVNENNHVLALGYNGMPVGCADDKMPWGKGNDNVLENKYFYVCHAELNAILNSGGRILKGARIYITQFPCCECAKAIIQVGIKRVIYSNVEDEQKASIKAAKKMFNMVGVKFEKYESGRLKIEVEV